MLLKLEVSLCSTSAQETHMQILKLSHYTLEAIGHSTVGFMLNYDNVLSLY